MKLKHIPIVATSAGYMIYRLTKGAAFMVFMFCILIAATPFVKMPETPPE